MSHPVALRLDIQRAGDGNAVLKLPARMEIQDAQALIEAFRKLLAREKMKALQVDFAQVVSFDSAGAASLLELMRGAKVSYFNFANSSL